MRPKIFSVFSVAVSLLLIGVGCTKQVVRNPGSVVQPSTTSSLVTAQTKDSGNPFAGVWLYEGESIYGGEDGFNLELNIEGIVVTGTFSSVLNRINPAVRIDTGTVTGMYNKTKNSISGNWEGDRYDAGTVTIRLDPKTNALIWNSTLRANGENFVPGDYSIPQSMRLVRFKPKGNEN